MTATSPRYRRQKGHDDLEIVKAYHLIGKTMVEVEVPMIMEYGLGGDPRYLAAALKPQTL